LAAKLKKRMHSGAPQREYRNSFDVAGLVPLIAYAVELALKYLPEESTLYAVVEGYAALYAETSARLYLDSHEGWLRRALQVGLETALI
jgi:hypothetical protein